MKRSTFFNPIHRGTRFREVERDSRFPFIYDLRGLHDLSPFTSSKPSHIIKDVLPRTSKKKSAKERVRLQYAMTGAPAFLHRSLTASNDDFVSKSGKKKTSKEPVPFSRRYPGYKSRVTIEPTQMDFNNLPYLRVIRLSIVLVCAASFFLAPAVYIPMGQIQAGFRENCLLYTDFKIMVDSDRLTENSSEMPLRFDASSSNLGSKVICHMATFAPVFAAITSFFIGWFSFLIWSDFMVNGCGGGLSLMFAFTSFCNVISCWIAYHFIRQGFEYTCSSIIFKHPSRPVTAVNYDSYKPDLSQGCSNLAVRDVMVLEVNTTFGNIINNTLISEGSCIVLTFAMGYLCVLSLTATVIVWKGMQENPVSVYYFSGSSSSSSSNNVSLSQYTKYT